MFANRLAGGYSQSQRFTPRHPIGEHRMHRILTGVIMLLRSLIIAVPLPRRGFAVGWSADRARSSTDVQSRCRRPVTLLRGSPVSSTPLGNRFNATREIPVWQAYGDGLVCQPGQTDSMRAVGRLSGRVSGWAWGIEAQTQQLPPMSLKCLGV
jgi:hypothetical protein